MKQTFFDYRARHGMGVPAARIATVRAILFKRLISYAILAGIQIRACSTPGVNKLRLHVNPGVD